MSSQSDEKDALSRADRDALYDRLAAMLCYEKHRQREGEFCPNCRSRAGTVHGPLFLGLVTRIAAEHAATAADANLGEIELRLEHMVDSANEAEIRWHAGEWLTDIAEVVRDSPTERSHEDEHEHMWKVEHLSRCPICNLRLSPGATS